MKKIILLIFITVLVAVSCTEKDAFTIEGTIPAGEYDGLRVALQTMDSSWSSRKLMVIDTARVVDGKFVFKGISKEGPVVHFLQLENAPDFFKNPVMLIVEPGTMKVKLDTVPIVGGTLANDAYQEYLLKNIRHNKEMKAMYEQMKKDTANIQLKADFEKKAQEGRKELNADIYKLIKANIRNQAGAYLFTSNFSRFSLEEMNELLSGIDPKFRGFPEIQKVENILSALNATAVGKTYTDLKAKTPDGEDISLSDYVEKDKYVFLDFWASWCGPCIKEMPSVKKAYEQYKDKGFEIVGISLDDSADAWKKAIEELGITWPQMSDLKAWESSLVTTYGVRYIPQTVLIDKEGKIIERDLRGDDIAKKLGELMD